MGDSSYLGIDVKRRSKRSSKVNRIVSLFEIPRPNKNKSLQRTNSLPASRRPLDFQSEEGNGSAGGSLKGYYHATGVVQRIKEEIEQKGKQRDVVSTPKPVKRKTHANKKTNQDRILSKESWLIDNAKIMEDLNRLHERMEDVTKEIQNSDTELEITCSKSSQNNEMFEDNEELNDKEVLRDKFSDEERETISSTLSNDTVLSRLSSETMEREPKSEDSVSVNFVSYYRFVSADGDGDVDDEKTDIIGAESSAVIERYSDDAESPGQENQEPVAAESSAVEEGEEVERIDDDGKSIPESGEDKSEVDSIDWWKHKSFVQINGEALSQTQHALTECTEDEDLEESSKYSESSPFPVGRFIKNNRASKRNKRTERRRTGMLQKGYNVKELAKQFEGFKDAAESGETENFRKSLINEMDKEIENMRNDGFKEDFHLSFENLTLIDHDYDERINHRADPELNFDLDKIDYASYKSGEGESPMFQTIFVFPPNQESESEGTFQDEDDLFGKNLFSEDLESGLYYVETYNADGKELIKCSVQIDRQSVDLSTFSEIKANSKANVLDNDERTLILMEGTENNGVETSSLSETKSGTDSKRTTIYSTTSGDSYEDDVYAETSPVVYGFGAARRETYCDDKGIVRIERVALYPENGGEPELPDYINTTNNYYFSSQETTTSNEGENYYEIIKPESESNEVKKETLQYILEEIKYTERKYIADMKKVLSEYKTFLEERCPEKVDVVFANMDYIYEKQLQFLEVLEDSDEEVKDVVQAFIDLEDLFRLYPRYFRNSPKANAAVKELSFLIKEKQERINDKLDLSAYLLTPLQRLGKYKLFLENIIKQLNKENKSTGSAQMALEIVKKYMSKGNDAVAIASILHSPLHTKDYGSFIAREKFLLIKPKRLELMVFLFEGAVVFTTEDTKSMEQFVYYQSIKTNDLRIATFEDNTIHLTDYTKTKRRNSNKYTYVIDARTPKLRATWKQMIEEILWKQMKKIKENTIKEYQSGNNATRRIPRSREQRSKSTGSSIFYVA